MATTVNLTLDQGTTFRKSLTIKDDSSAVIDITGYTFRGQARASYGNATTVLAFDFAVRTQTGGNVGIVDMSLPASATDALVLKGVTNYVYDVEMVEPGGTVYRLFQGTLAVSPSATV